MENKLINCFKCGKFTINGLWCNACIVEYNNEYNKELNEQLVSV